MTSGLGVGVPGTIRGWEQALGKFGSRPLSDLLQPSIRLASRGFVVDQTYHQQTFDNVARFEDFTSTRETFLRKGNAPAVGSTVRNPDLAATYSRIAEGGGKRPRSSMSPTIVTRDGQPILALGSPGGSTIITSVLQVLVNDLDFGMTLPQAIAAPRASQRNTAQTSAEPAFLSTPEATHLVSDHGQTFTSTPELGAVTGIAFPGRTVQAAAEPTRRGGGSALVQFGE